MSGVYLNPGKLLKQFGITNKLIRQKAANPAGPAAIAYLNG